MNRSSAISVSPRLHVFVASRVQYESFSRHDVGAPVAWCALGKDILPDSERDRLVCDLYKYLTPACMEEHSRCAWMICDAIAEIGKGKYVVDGFDVIETCADDIAYNTMYTLNMYTAVSTAVDSLGCSWVASGRSMQRILFWDPPDVPSDILNAVVRMVCAERDIAWMGLPDEIDRQVESASCSYAPPDELVTEIPKTVHGISICESEIAIAERAAFHKQQARQKIITWLHCGDTLAHDGIPYYPWLRARRLPIRTKQCHEVDIKEIAANAVRSVRPNLVPILLNQHLDFVWKSFSTICSGAERLFHLGRIMCRAFRPAVVVTPYDVVGYRKAFKSGFEREGARSICLLHGGICRPSALIRHRRNHGDMAVWGNWDKEKISKYVQRKGTIHVVGCMREDIDKVLHTENIALEKGVRPRQPPVILLITARVISPYGGSMDLDTYHVELSTVLRRIQRESRWRVIIKAHPRYDHYSLYEQIAVDIPNVELSTARLATWLHQADVAIMFNQITTAAVEVIGARVPLLAYGESITSACADIFGDALRSVQHPDDLVAEIDRLLRCGTARDEYMSKLRAIIPHIICATGEKAAANLCSTLSELECGGSRSMSVDKPARWLLDLMRLLEQIIAGVHSPVRTLTHCWTLRRRARNFDCDAVPEVDLNRIGAIVLDMLLWDVPRGARGLYLRQIAALKPLYLWCVHCTLPKKWRATVRELWSFIFQACKNQMQMWDDLRASRESSV